MWQMVCACVGYTPIQLLVWELPLGVLVLHSAGKLGSIVGEEKERRRVGQQMLSWGLDCVVSQKSGLEEERRKAKGERGDHMG